MRVVMACLVKMCVSRSCHMGLLSTMLAYFLSCAGARGGVAAVAPGASGVGAPAARGHPAHTRLHDAGARTCLLMHWDSVTIFGMRVTRLCIATLADSPRLCGALNVTYYALKLPTLRSAHLLSRLTDFDAREEEAADISAFMLPSTC